MGALRVLGRQSSINVRKVLWTCEEIGIDYVQEDWGTGFASTSTPEFLALNPNGLVWPRRSPATLPMETGARRTMDGLASDGAQQCLARCIPGPCAQGPRLFRPLRHCRQRQELESQDGNPGEHPRDDGTFRSGRRIHAGRHPDRPFGQQMVSHAHRTTQLTGGYSLFRAPQRTAVLPARRLRHVPVDIGHPTTPSGAFSPIVVWVQVPVGEYRLVE